MADSISTDIIYASTDPSFSPPASNGVQLLSASSDTRKYKHALFDVRQGTVVIESITYKVVHAYFCTNFDMSGWKFQYKYDIIDGVPTSGNVKHDDPVYIPDFSLNGVRPSMNDVYLPYCYKTVLYFPASYTLVACHLDANDSGGGEFEHIKYKRKGALKLNDYVVTDINDVVKTEVTIDGSAIVSYINLSTDTNAATKLLGASSVTSVMDETTLKTSGRTTQSVSGELVPGTLRVTNAQSIKVGESSSTDVNLNTLLEGKIDKVSTATSGNLAGLDASGNLTDSGKSASSFVQTTGQISQSVAGTLNIDSVYVGGTRVAVVNLVPDPPVADTLYFVTGS